MAEIAKEVASESQIQSATQELDLALFKLQGVLAQMRLARTKAEVLFNRAIDTDENDFLESLPKNMDSMVEAYERLPEPEDITNLINDAVEGSDQAA